MQNASSTVAASAVITAPILSYLAEEEKILVLVEDVKKLCIALDTQENNLVAQLEQVRADRATYAKQFAECAKQFSDKVSINV